MPLRTKKELLTLPIRMLTLTEFSWAYPDKTCIDHYLAIKEAIENGEAVEHKALLEYPSLKNVTIRRKRGKRSESSAGDGKEIHG
jgi:hypothetical protein